MIRRRAVGLAAAALLLAGCSATPTAAPPSPAVTVSVQGSSLRDYGFRNGPDLVLVSGLTITRSVDQPNVVTLLTPPSDAKPLLDQLKQSLPAQGWTITASSGDSLIFHTTGWEGAFTSDAQIAGLTLRRVS